MSEQPKCGGGGLNEGDYDLPLHIAAVCKLSLGDPQLETDETDGRKIVMVFAFSIGGTHPYDLTVVPRDSHQGQELASQWQEKGFDG
jgi:hypothetical protein